MSEPGQGHGSDAAQHGSEGEAAGDRRHREGNRLILAGIAIFLAACVLLVVFSSHLVPVTVPEPGYAVAPTAAPHADATFTATLDVSDRNQWVAYSFLDGRLVDGVEGADLAVRRNVVRAPFGALDLGVMALKDATLPAGAAWQSDREQHGAFQNPAFERWYAYSYWTHLLHPKGHVHAVKLRDGGVAFVRFDSYYCVPEGSGCLTITWRLADAG